MPGASQRERSAAFLYSETFLPAIVVCVRAIRAKPGHTDAVGEAVGDGGPRELSFRREGCDTN